MFSSFYKYPRGVRGADSHPAFAGQKWTALRVLTTGLAIFIGATTSATATHNGATLSENHGVFRILGNAAKQSCAAQANVKSVGAQNVGLSLFWLPSKSIHLLVSHPKVTAMGDTQKVRFIFPDGTNLSLRMALQGTQLQALLGLGSGVPSLFQAVKTNASVMIEMVEVGDRFQLDLSARDSVQKGLEDCREWLI